MKLGKKKKSPESKAEKWSPWISLFLQMITVGIALYGIYHQANLEEANRKEDREKWEKSFLAQIQLANTNRQADFSIWQQQLAAQIFFCKIF